MWVRVDFLTQSLTEICEYSLVSPGRALVCTIIVNPCAGGFKIRSRRKPHIKTLNECRQKAKANPRRETKINVVYTKGKGCGEKTTRELIEQASKDVEPFYLIISAGGDGTSQEILFALYDMPAHVCSNVAVLRLPFGTGNDGADSASLEKTLDLLIKPVHIELTPAVQLIPANTPKSSKRPFLAFNILSIGLDAYVTHMTNKMKGKVPGDSYKLWVDIAALFYDHIYNVDFIDVRALDEQNHEVCSFREKLLLIAMGVSGYRTYGAQQKILSDNRNVCAVKQMPLYRKLVIKDKVATGIHIDCPEVILFNAHRLEIFAAHPLLAQMDGETVLLQREDFPVVMELTKPVIPLLKGIMNNEK
jgi:diacylglycerol kinase family enzyme